MFDMTATRPTRRRWRNAALGALALGAMAGTAVAQKTAVPPAAIEVQAKKIDAFDPRDRERKQFGLLEFRGGLVLTSPHRQFGGFSALRVAPDGAHFLALSDKGWW